MRDLHEPAVDRFRRRDVEILMHYRNVGDGQSGAFIVPSPIDGKSLRIVASNDEGWDHVSISRAKRCPNWQELEHVRKLFFEENETVMQLHLPDQDHINHHPYCLHLWRPHHQEIPRPPARMVA